MKHLHLYVFTIVLFIIVIQTFAEGENSEITVGTSEASVTNGNNNTAKALIKRNLNIILFITDIPKNYTFHKKIKDVWNFDFIKLMKPCKTKIRSVKFRRVSRRKKTICECEAALKQNLLMLIDWARETAGMLTAVVSLTEHSYTDAISSETNRNGEHYGFNYFNFKLESNGENNSDSEQDDFIEFPLKQKKSDDKEELSDLITSEDNNFMPLINSYPKGFKLNKKFNIRKRFWSPYQIEHFKSLIKSDTRRRYRTGNNEGETTENIETTETTESAIDTQSKSSQHGQVKQEVTTNYFVESTDHATNMAIDPFTASVANDLDMNDGSESELLPKEPSNVEQLSDIMSSIKKQLLHNMIEEPQSAPQAAFKQPNMKELVTVTFNQTIGLKRGYLLLFMGRSISELDNPNSDLGESLQYLIDNAKESNTVIIVSGGCTEGPKEETEDMEPSKNGNVVPLLALGPDAENDYGKVDDLCKLPEAIRSSIERHRIKERKRNLFV